MGLMQKASRTILGLDLLFILLLAFSLSYVEPGTGSYVVAQLTLVPVVFTAAASVFILYTGWSPFEE